ncbi:hypothetical protein C0991_006086 [Blastosporella zonata]|nr:hypothetical protein C0991_006086 [Blastosporella zonata]
MELPYRVRWQDLKDLFRRAGTVLRADVSLGPDNRSRGYGTVLLATAEDAGRAIDIFNGFSWQTRILEVRPDRLPPDYDANHPPPILTAPYEDDQLDYSALLDLHHNYPANLSLRTLFVANDLKDLFRQAGAVMRADVALAQDGRSKGFGTVTFATEGDADRAVQMFDGYEYNGRTLKVNHDKFTQLAQPNLRSLASTPSSIPPPPSIRSAPDSRGSSAYQPRQLSSLAPQSDKLPITYHLGLGSGSTSPTPFDVWQQQENTRDDRDREWERDLLRSFSALDISLGRTLSNYSAPAPSASRSTSTSSTQPPSIATTTSTSSMLSSSSLAVSTPTSNSSENSRLSPSFQHHRRLSSTKTEHRPASPPTSSVTAHAIAPSTSSSSAQSRLQAHRSPPRHPGPIAIPPPPPVTSFTHSHPQLNISSHNGHGLPPLHHPHSPLYHPMTHHQQQVEQIKQMQQQYQMTPLGLPPMTPSMPSFNFLPPSTSSTGTIGHPPYSPYAHPHSLPSPMQMPHLMMMHGNGSPGSPLHNPLQPQPPHSPQQQHHPSPFGITPLSPPGSATVPTFAASASASASGTAQQYSPFSPGVTMSPGALWGRPGGANPLINPTVGAPVHASEPTGYFDGAWYASSSVGGSGLANEILKNGDRGGGDVLDGVMGFGRKVIVDDDDGDGDDKDGCREQADGDEMHDREMGSCERRGARARRHSSTTTTPWQSHPGAPETDFRAWARNQVAESGTVDLNSELALLVDGGLTISRTHSMSAKKKALLRLGAAAGEAQDGVGSEMNQGSFSSNVVD